MRFHRVLSTGFLFALAVMLRAYAVEAQIPLDGSFVARRVCPAFQSFRQETNPGNVMTVVDRAYSLVGKNAADATHYLVEVPEASPPRRWVAAECGTYVGGASGNAATRPSPVAPETKRRDFVLAVSWQPAFCEIRPHKPECRSTGADFAATHLSLHGLWPQPQSVEYCGISPAQRSLDRDGRWDQLDPVHLTGATRDALDRAMPGTRSHLERHEWTRHGSCYGTTPDEYFRDAIALVTALDASPIQGFLAEHVGRTVSTNDLRARFDRAFGGNAGSRVAFVCGTDRDSGRTLLTEIRINVRGTIGATPDLATLLLSAPTVPRGCGSGVIDPVGLQ
jgi:ribonuclease T2